VRVLIKKRIFLLALLIAIIITLKPSFVHTAGRVVFDIVMYPLRSVVSFKKMCIPKKKFIKENFMLKEQSAQLALEIGRIVAVGRENERLRDLLALKKRTPYTAHAAGIIARAPSTWMSTVIIDKGASSGIHRKMAVCVADGLVGTVVDVSSHTGKVMLITDPNSRIGVRLMDSGQTGVLVGDREGKCRVIYLGMDSDIHPGERVVTSGVGGEFPSNLPVGTVVRVGRDMVGLYQYAIVRPYSGLNALAEVLCLE